MLAHGIGDRFRHLDFGLAAESCLTPTAADSGRPQWQEAAARSGGTARQTALALGLAQHLHKVERTDLWTAAELALLGTLPDAELATRTGRKETVIRAKRSKYGIGSLRAWRRRENKP
jgi:hypothetical protein